MQKLILGNFMIQTLKALSAIHSKREAHGDLHPKNVLVFIRSSVKNERKKIKFSLHDRSYASGRGWLESLCKETPKFHNANLLNEDTINEIRKLANDKTKNDDKKWIPYLQLWDLEQIRNDIFRYAENVGDRSIPQSGWDLSIAISCLNNCENAVDALKEPSIDSLRDEVCNMNKDTKDNIIDNIFG